MRPLPFHVQAMISTTFISVVPILLIYILNLVASKTATRHNPLNNELLSFAMGGLLGDVFFHTLPHLAEAQNSGGHGHSDHVGHHHVHSADATRNNLIIVMGIWAFFILEKLVKTFFEGGHDHSAHSGKKAKEHHEKEVRLKAFAAISLVGDLIHNFTDGLSIGVSYVANYRVGLMTTAAMFFHEVPHEVGDFAILTQLKFSLWQIVGLQGLTALGALAGTAVGALVG